MSDVHDLTRVPVNESLAKLLTASRIIKLT